MHRLVNKNGYFLSELLLNHVKFSTHEIPSWASVRYDKGSEILVYPRIVSLIFDLRLGISFTFHFRRVNRWRIDETSICSSFYLDVEKKKRGQKITRVYITLHRK